MPGWLSDDELRQKLAAVVKAQGDAGDADPDRLPAWWDQHVSDANQDAHASILAALASRGFAAADLRGWALGKAYQADLGLYRLLVKGGVGEGAVAVDAGLLDRLNRLAELDTLLLTDADGVALVPGDVTETGPVGHGDMFRGGAGGESMREKVGGVIQFKKW